MLFEQPIFYLCAADEKLEVMLRKIGFLNILKSKYYYFRPMPSFAHAVYFWFSLIFLIIRTLAVSLYSAGIHDESKKPINVLRSVPHDSWCVEVQRFSEEVVNGTVALSGMQFFYLTRKLILNVSSSWIIY